MPAPVSVSLAAITGRWPAITVSGVTGSHATALNSATAGDYVMMPDLIEGYPWWEATNGSSIQHGDDSLWYFFEDGNAIALLEGVDESGEVAAPYLIPSWSDVGPGDQSLTFVRALAPPRSVVLDGAAATVQAALTTALTGTNNDLVFTAVPAGRLGNDISIRYLDPAANSQALAIGVSGRAITASLATDGAGAITSTAALIKTAIEASEAAAALVTVANAAANDGTGVVTALAATNLSGGLGGLPLPPESVTI